MLEDLLVAAFDAPRDQAAAGLAHQCKHLLVNKIDAAVACPLDANIFLDDHFAQFDNLVAVHGEQVGVHVDVMDAQFFQIPELLHDQFR